MRVSSDNFLALSISSHPLTELNYYFAVKQTKLTCVVHPDLTQAAPKQKNPSQNAMDFIKKEQYFYIQRNPNLCWSSLVSGTVNRFHKKKLSSD